MNRFADLIKEFSPDDTGDFLVTHRKGDLECADCYALVTMGGIRSFKVFSVRPEVEAPR